MIATHDTLTYLHPRHFWWRLLAPWWRTQSRSVAQQLADGVRYFDIRLRYDSRGYPVFCHGLVDFRDTEAMAAVRTILRAPSARYRILLERGNSADEVRFCQEICESFYSGLLSGLDKAIIKQGWRTVLETAAAPVSIRDLTRPAFLSDRHWWKQPRGLLRALVPIRRWALRHNKKRQITAGACADGEKAYMFDFYELSMNINEKHEDNI